MDHDTVLPEWAGILAQGEYIVWQGARGSVHFATKDVRTKHGYKTKDIGFERISNGAEVYALIRDIQKGHHDTTI